MSLLGGALLDPAELSEGQLGGDGGGQRQLVVGTSGSLQFQTWKNSNDVRHQCSRGRFVMILSLE